ncbi:MAG: alpha/beta hydrolase [Clostridiales bacterium]|nr:alpha/beta hydrolase [Clostridiales bacterium]
MSYANVSKYVALLMTLLMTLLNTFGVFTNDYDKDKGSVTTYKTWEECVEELDSIAAEGKKSDCGEDCEHCPTIVVPGIGQSNTYLCDAFGNKVKNENGDVVTGWPLYVNVDEVVDKIAAPLVTAIATQQDNGFSDIVAQTAADALSVNACGLDGLPVNNIVVEKYYKSVAECTEEERAYILKTIPLDGYVNEVGADHLYYFAYNSFGDTLGIAEELYAYIQMVKAQTGHDKVNIVPISLGGTIANALLYLYAEELKDDLNRIVFIVPALDGSKIVSDVYGLNLSTEDEMLYSGLIPSLMPDDYLAYVINMAIRLLPKQVLADTLDKVNRKLVTDVLANCPSMWALVASEDYPALADMWLSDEDHAYLKERTGDYYQAQLESDANILALRDAGVEIFDVVDYGVPMYSIAASWDDYNADGIIHVDSTSAGATTSLVGSTLSTSDYKAGAVFNCTNPAHDHISPDGSLDASTSILPETSWYFYSQNHESTAKNNIIMYLAIDLLVDDAITDVYSDERYPQFMYARNTRGFINSDIPLAESILSEEAAAPGTYDAQLIADTNAALAKAYHMVEYGNIPTDEVEAIKAELYECLYASGKWTRPDPSQSDDNTEEYALMFFKAANDALYKYYGPIGFSDYMDGEFWKYSKKK